MTLINSKYLVLIRTDSECYKTTGRIAPKGILIHGTGANNALLGRWVKTENTELVAENPNSNWFGGKNNKGTVPHAVCGVLDGSAVGKEEIGIVQILPYDFRPWGCSQGKYGSYNDSHIQIEMCQDVARGKSYLEKVLRATAEWCAELMAMYPDITIENIVSHKEAAAKGYANNHGDPENWLDLYNISMEQFRTSVKSFYNEKKNSANKLEMYYRVQIGAFTDRKRATEYANTIREKFGLECFVTGGVEEL